MFEIARRHKIMNPEKMRTEYGKLIYLLQDAVSPSLQPLLSFSCKVRFPICALSSFASRNTRKQQEPPKEQKERRQLLCPGCDEIPWPLLLEDVDTDADACWSSPCVPLFSAHTCLQTNKQTNKQTTTTIGTNRDGLQVLGGSQGTRGS